MKFKRTAASVRESAPLPLPPMSPATLLRVLFKRPRRQSGLPTPRTRYLLEPVDAGQLRRYRAALGFDGDAIPLTWWYLPAQRAQVATMLDEAFPFRLPGTVHTANLLRAHGASDPEAPMLLTTSVTVQPPADNGAVFALLETRGEQDGRAVFDCDSSYLMVRGRPRKDGRPQEAPLPACGGWQVAPGCGRRYARLSGDWNPIHLWTWSARLMGMREPIIHGMHSLARACAELERLHGRRLGELEARFRAPVPHSSELAFGFDAGRFTVAREGRIAVGGRFAFTPADSL
jgi:hypothetical protein